MTDRPDIDNQLDELGQEVRRAFSDAALSAEQQQHHLSRLRNRRKVARFGGATGDAGKGGRSLGRLSRVPRDGNWRGQTASGARLLAGMSAVGVVAIIVAALFQSLTGFSDSEQPSGTTLERPYPRGWTYPSNDLPGGGQLAFVSNQGRVPQIAVVNADGSGLEILTDDASTHWGPSWSADGAQLAWASDARGMAQVYVANADGSGVDQRSIFVDNRDPRWSPDGDWIAFISTRDMRTGIYVMPAAGGGGVNITDGVSLGRGAIIAWSPDSSALVFETAGDLYTVNRDGSGLRQLTDHPAIDSAPDWSPDGSRIAFFSDREGNSEIYVINVDGSGLARLTETTDNEYQPTWSPDGWTIAYLRAPAKAEPDYETQLWSMGANGAAPRRLGDVTGYAMGPPGWSPDSRQIAVVAAPKGTDLSTGTISNGRLYVISAGGSNQRLVHDQVADLGRPVWRPLWWPDETSSPTSTVTSRPVLTLDVAEGDCQTEIVVHGSGFEPGATVNLYGSPAIDSNFATVAAGIIVAADGSFEATFDLSQFAGCLGRVPDGGDYHIGAATELARRDGAILSDLSASVVFTVRE